MMMYFHFSWSEVVLFNGWRTTEPGSFFGTCFALIVFSLIYEWIMVVQHNREVDLHVSQDAEMKSLMTTKYVDDSCVVCNTYIAPHHCFPTSSLRGPMG